MGDVCTLNNVLQSLQLSLALATTLQIWCWDPGETRRCQLPVVADGASLAAPMGQQALVTL